MEELSRVVGFMLVTLPHYLSFLFASYFSEYYVLRGFFTFPTDPTRGDVLPYFLRIFIVLPLLSVYSDQPFVFLSSSVYYEYLS
jgi:hypothetical protein